MVEALKTHFLKLMKIVDGLHAIIITDRDGVPVLKVRDENAPELATKPKFLSTFGMATEQASKLGLSTNKIIITTFNAYQVIHLNKFPLIVTFIAKSSANTGMILSLEADMQDALQKVKEAVDVS